MKNSQEVRKVEQFYEKVKTFTECDSINYRMFFVSIVMVMAMCFVFCFIYFQYGGLNNIFDYPEKQCDCMTEEIEEGELQTEENYSRIEIVLQRTVEITFVMTIATMISIFLTFLLMKIFRLFVFLYMKIVIYFSKN